MENILKTIIDKKKERVKILKKKYVENEILKDIRNFNNFVDFKNSIKKKKFK